MICTFSVLHRDIQIPNKPVKALLRLSDALKCVELGTTKVKEKSCVREQVSKVFFHISIIIKTSVEFYKSTEVIIIIYKIICII